MSFMGRKRILIHPRFQLKITGLLAIIGLSTSFIFYTLASYIIWKIHENFLTAQVPLNNPVYLLIEQHSTLMDQYFGVIVIMIFCFYFTSVSYTHLTLPTIYSV